MAKTKTKYPGIFTQESKDRSTGRTVTKFFIQYYDLNKKRRMELCGQSNKGMTAAKANQMRVRKISGQVAPNQVEREKTRKNKEESTKYLNSLFQLYQVSKRIDGGYASESGDRSNWNIYLNPYIGQKKTQEVNEMDLQKVKTKLSSLKRSTQTQRHVFELLRRIIRYAEDYHRQRPVEVKIKLPTAINQHNDILSSDEIGRLIHKLMPEESDTIAYRQAKNIMRMAIYTGMRRNEIFKMEWKNIDIKNGILVIPAEDAKNNREWKIPLCEHATVLLKELRGNRIKNNNWVFPSVKSPEQHVKNTNRHGQKIRKDLGLPLPNREKGIVGWRYHHGLRHLFASFVASEAAFLGIGGELDIVGTLLNHIKSNDKNITKRYVHFLEKPIRRALDSLDKELYRIEGGDLETHQGLQAV